MQPFQQQVHEITSQINPQNGSWHLGNASSQALEWAVQALAKAGTLSTIGMYPLTLKFFPIGITTTRANRFGSTLNLSTDLIAR